MDWEAFYNHFREPNFIAGYEIQNRLGGGAFGEVYKARKHSIGKAYAIKFLKIDDDAQRDAVERELEQVRHFAAIDHPNLVTIEDLGTVLDVPYLIMGYAGEDTLARALRTKRLDPDTALLYFVQACRGVLALHDRRLVHFDLKPSNIFIKGDIARVGDYGLSKMMTDGRLTLSFGRGTPMYMAPEMLKNRADHRADLYSLGVILYESVSGKLPFESALPGTIAVREDDTPPQFPADFPVHLRRVAERCLRLDPEQRYASVCDLLEDLGQTARPGDSVRIDRVRTSELDARPATPREIATPSIGRSDARQTAAELTRGAVEVARGVWDGLRTASAGARPMRDGTHASSTPTPAPIGPPSVPPVPSEFAGRDLQLPPANMESVVMHGLSDGARSPPLIAAHTSTISETRGTIPVPPEVKGGWIGTSKASFLLAIEVLFTLIRGLARKAAGGFEKRGVARRVGSGLVRSTRSLVASGVRLALFLALLAILGGLATWIAVLFMSRVSA